MQIKTPIFNAVCCLCFLLGGGWLFVIPSLSVTVITIFKSSISSDYRVKTLEKARAVRKMEQLKGLWNDLTEETEFEGESKLLLPDWWKKKFWKFLTVYVLPWDKLCESEVFAGN